MPEKNAPIGVFDSGVGGISVLRQLTRLMPREDYFYFGDSRNAPYGPRPLREVRGLTLDAAEMLFDRGCKALMVACNTATSAAIATLRETWPGRTIIGIEPALKPAAVHARVLVLATEMTLREDKFRRLLASCGGNSEVCCMAAPGIVEQVERGGADSPELDAYLRELLAPFRDNPPGAVVLGCTHFPFAREAISHALGGGVVFYDGAEGAAREMQRRLAARGLLTDRERPGRAELTNSRPEMTALCRKLFEQ